MAAKYSDIERVLSDVNSRLIEYTLREYFPSEADLAAAEGLDPNTKTSVVSDIESMTDNIFNDLFNDSKEGSVLDLGAASVIMDSTAQAVEQMGVFDFGIKNMQKLRSALVEHYQKSLLHNISARISTLPGLFRG
ncbi:hypothetical protein KY359_00820, partial [Candidatus Woesearchaeota archaeon]|nr:hypothetical protein [Candidatus Woesearchaeota archaeon]